ncbi:hypothetical protein JNK62_00740 [bacterium]|nr:hypothetical protein [bacterium]
MSDKHHGILSILAAILVLGSAMIDPSVSIVIATAALGLLGGYQIFKK